MHHQKAFIKCLALFGIITINGRFPWQSSHWDLLVKFFNSFFSNTANFLKSGCCHTATIQSHCLRVGWNIQWYETYMEVWGTIKKFSAPVLWEWPRAEIVPLFLNIFSLNLNALSPMLFQLAYPFKTEAFFLVPKVLINSIYHTFIASKIPTFWLVFKFGNR